MRANLPEWSPSARRAWVEIARKSQRPVSKSGRPPQGGRGLKYIILVMVMSHASSPSARRAWVEITSRRSRARPTTSPSARRAWVEIWPLQNRARQQACRPPQGGRGLKFLWLCNGHSRSKSPSARRAWVEICKTLSVGNSFVVALRKEGVG